MACNLTNSAGSRTWSDLVPRVKPSVRGAPEAVIEDALRMAAIDFCRRTEVLKKYFEIDVQKGVSDYYLELESCATPIRIFSVNLDNRYGHSPAPGDTWNWCGCCGGYEFSSESPTHVRVSPITGDDRQRALAVTLVVAPAQDSCTLDDFLFQQWAEAITFGARARLHGMLGSSVRPNAWYSPQEEAKFRKAFDVEMARAKLEVGRGYHSGPVRARARRWA